MNWITTNLRLPEDIYNELKITAVKERKSLAAVIREKLAEKKIDNKEQKRRQELLIKMKILREEISRENPGLNLTQAVIDARYEQ